MVDNVIILGAGASAAEGAPVQAKLFKEYFLLKRKNGEPINKHLISYFYNFWQINLNTVDLEEVLFPSFEEALGMLELAKQRQEYFLNLYNTTNYHHMDQIIEELIFLIAEVLQRTLGQFSKLHTLLVEKMVNNNKIRNTSFISLNYDILIDNSLTKLHDVIDLDYGIDFVNFNEPGNWHRPHPDNSIKLFKIHGSLNWLYCPICKKIRITPLEKSVTLLISKNLKNRLLCHSCKALFVPILVPPTFFKIMSNPYLVQIWDKAENALRECKNIIFCGYSIPQADIHIKYLLKRGTLNRSTPHPNIVVVNNYPGKPMQTKEEEKIRFIRLFGKERVHYSTITTFKSFCTRPGLYLV